MISIRVYPHTSANIKGVEGRSLGRLLHPVQSTDSSRVWVCQEYGNWESSLLKSKCRRRCIYICLSAIMTTVLSAIRSQGKILMICNILCIYLSMYSVPFLIYLQRWHHPVQSNFSRHLYMNYNMYSYLNTSLSHFSISYSCSLVALLGCFLLLLSHLWLWDHHAVLLALSPLVPPLGTADLLVQWLQGGSSSPVMMPTVLLLHRETLETVFTMNLPQMTDKCCDHSLQGL